MYFKTSEQQLFGRNLGCKFHGKWDFHCSQEKLFKLSPKSGLFSWDKHGAQHFKK